MHVSEVLGYQPPDDTSCKRRRYTPVILLLLSWCQMSKIRRDHGHSYNQRMALDSELSALREVLSNALVDIDNFRSTINHSHQRRTRSSIEPDSLAKRGNQICENTIKELASYLRGSGGLVDPPDPGGDSHPATSPGDLGGSPDAAAAERNAAAMGSDPPAEHANGPPLALGCHQMGRDLVRNLKDLCDSDGGVRGKITCTGVPSVDLGSLRLRIPIPKKESGVVFAVKYARCRDIVTLIKAHVSHFHCPVSGGSIQRPTDKEIEQFIDGIMALPPAASIAYYVGDGLTKEFDWILETDDELRRLREAGTDIRGVNTTYWLLGGAGSGTAAHCEDMNLRSCNITLEGYKWWILIDTGSTNAFEEWARSLDWPDIKPEQDDQWVRRMNLIPTKAMLDEKGIGFSEYVTGPGEMITTAPRQYHWVINVTDSLSLAINFAFDGELQKGLESLDSLPLTKRSPMWSLRQKRDQMKTTGSSLDAAGQPPPPCPGEPDSNSGEPDSLEGGLTGEPISQDVFNPGGPSDQDNGSAGDSVSYDDANGLTPINQDVTIGGTNDHDRGRPQRKAARAVAADAYHERPPAKRQRRGKGRGDRNTSSGRHRQQEGAPSNTSRGLLPQTLAADDSWYDDKDLPRNDKTMFRVLLTLRGMCAANNCFAILQAWRNDDCRPRRLISDYLSSKIAPQQPNGCIGNLAARSSYQTLLDRLLNSWAQLQVFSILYGAFGHTLRFDDYHRSQIPTLLGACDVPTLFRDVRSWYNHGLLLDRISPGTLEGLAIHCLLPQDGRCTKDHLYLASKSDIGLIEGGLRISRLQALYKEHHYTNRLIQQTVKLITNVVSNTQITQPQDPVDVVRRFQEALSLVDRDSVLTLLDPNQGSVDE